MDAFEERLKESLSQAYDIERELGGGGMSRVFVATDRLLGRRIVIKLLSPELIAEVNRGRFRREIQVAAQLTHPHIVTLLSAGEDGDLVYYTMPFIEGESLKSALEKNGQLPVRDVIRVLYDVVDALAYAHAHGVIHRDIKPANILRSGNHALVTDFGVAKALNAAMPSSAMTSTGMAIGTPAYMAPEQLAGDPAADHRIDIYAVGLLAYELLAGQSPFHGSTLQAVMAALLTLEPKPLNEVRKDVPPRMSAIIMQCLAKDPNDRPPTAEALLTQLDMIATTSGEIRTREHKVPKKERTVTAPVAVAEKGHTKRSRSKFLVGGIALLILATAIGILVSRRTGQKPAVATAEPPKAGLAVPAAAPGPAASSVTANPAAVPPVITAADSLAIAETVRKRLAQAAAAKTPGQTEINADSLKQRVQREVTDSIARAKAALAAVPAPIAPPVLPTAPAASGPRRLAIAEPGESKEQPAINTFSRALSDALRGSLSKGGTFAAIDQDSVRGVLGHTDSRDEAVKILHPDVLVSPSYTGAGDTVKITVSVRDLRPGSTYGIHLISARVMPAYPQYYLAPIVQAVLKQLDDLSRAPTIFGR
jgi:eukaryotic-like serine/threonine-protein kinase